MNNSIVSIQNLSYTYPDKRTGLHNISLQLNNGARVALIGKNGCGKTTLLLNLAGLLPGTGSIEMFGCSINKKSAKKIRNKIGFLFNQPEYQFIMPDVLNDVMLNITHHTDVKDREKAAMNWLKKFGIDQYCRYSPLQLSAGEMKRAALAGIFAKKPQLVLMDEPLNNIDKSNSLLLLSMLNSLSETMIIATHRLLLVEQLATHIAVMEGGRLIDFLAVHDKKCNQYKKQLLF